MIERQDTIAVDHGGPDAPVRIAMRSMMPRQTGGPGFLWLGGFKSAMAGAKASAIAAWAGKTGIGFTRFDYSGHGLSGGRFEDGTISRWLAESEAVLARCMGAQVLVGSSMGGWLALLLARNLPARIAGLVLIAPAMDMTQRLMWDAFPPQIRRTIQEQGVYMRASAYGDGPYAITRTLIEDGRQHLLGDGPLQLDIPVRVLHGMRDPDVPWQGSLTLVDKIAHDDVALHLIKDGDHRLSRPQDLRRLTGVLEGFTAL